jgi:opacity protein-like surface antigen
MRFTSIPFKLTASALLLAASTFAFAGHANVDFKNEVPPCPCPPTLMDGFYVGAEVSYDVLVTHASFNRTADLTISGTPHLETSGWDGGLFLGYGKYLTDIFYLGGEVFGYWSGASTNMSINVANLGSIKGTLDANGSYGLALLPGVKINQTTLAYLKGGYVWSNIHTNGQVFNASGVATYSDPKDRNVNGWEFGVGMETLLVDNWSLRADYTYVDYNNGGHHNVLTGLNPKDNVFQVGVVYHVAM